MNRKLVGSIIHFFGLGVLVHDYAHALWQVGGYKEILSPQGGWIGLCIAVAGWIIVVYDEIARYLRRLSQKPDCKAYYRVHHGQNEAD